MYAEGARHVRIPAGPQEAKTRSTACQMAQHKAEKKLHLWWRHGKVIRVKGLWNIQEALAPSDTMPRPCIIHGAGPLQTIVGKVLF